MRPPVKGRMRPFMGTAHVPSPGPCMHGPHSAHEKHTCTPAQGACTLWNTDQRSASAAVISLTADFASPNSIVVSGS
jgi:hypothetical protein